MQLNKEVKPKIINDTIDIKENLKYIENKLQKHNNCDDIVSQFVTIYSKKEAPL